VTRLQRLHAEHGQSPWLDNLTRDHLVRGSLARFVDDGIRGVTSNPTIFAKAISGSDAYDEQFSHLVRAGRPVEDAYWAMVVADVIAACDLLADLHERSGGDDGFVSIEVSPALAMDEDATVAAARELHDRIGAPNLFVKVPGTTSGVAAVRRLVAEGRNVNVTLLFSLERYGEVIDAYLDGLEAFAAAGGDLRQVRSVASFFVSRVDTEVDRRLEAIGTPAALGLRGTAAVAQARLAYQLFRCRFSGPRWESLRARGANLQRPLWASTSTKNPAYPDTLYVDSLIGPDTVNTMPEATIAAFEDHGTLARTLDADPDGARAALDRVGEVGVDLADVAAVLEAEGVAAFAKSFDELLALLAAKAAEIAE
jgi:transaldolase